MAFPFSRVQIGCGSLLLIPTILANPQTSSPNNNESWTSSTETLSSTAAPSRELETHIRNGNRVLDNKTLQVRGLSGSYEAYSDTESEVIQDNATTSHRIVRSYASGLSGERQLTQVSEETTTAAGAANSSTVRIISEPDSLGNLQVVERDTIESKRTAAGTVKSKYVRFAKDPAGTLVPRMQTDEEQNVQSNGEEQLTSKTSVPNLSGEWQVIEQKERTTRNQVRGRRVEEITWQPDFAGTMSEVARVLKQDAIVNGRRVETLETYSPDVIGTVRDGTLHLVNRSTTMQENSPERSVAEETIEQPAPTDVKPGDLTIMANVSHAVAPTLTGTKETITTSARNLDGNFTIVSEETRQSTQIPMQIVTSPADRPK
jgi:hypothetical protein